MTYRLIALDLDGTLLDSRLQIRPETIEALNHARAQGVQVMIVTGRHHVAVYPYWYQLGLELPAICCNGTYVYDFAAGDSVVGNPLPRLVARKLLALARQHSIQTMVYVADAMIYEFDSPPSPFILEWAATLQPALRPRIDGVNSLECLVDETATIWKFLAVGNDVPAMRAFASEIEQSLGLSCEWSGDHRLDIVHAGNTKGNRLAEWCAGQGIALDQVIAFGDQQNDMDMLRVAGLGVAMGNSLADVQACADWVTGTNDSNGIADALRRFVLTST